MTFCLTFQTNFKKLVIDYVVRMGREWKIGLM